LNDLSGELVKGAAAEQRGRKKAAAAHVPDPQQAAQRDKFCEELMRRGRCEDASVWIGARQHTLGEKSHAASRKLVTKLLELGCVKIHACEIQVEDEVFQNTSHLVTELPSDAEARRRVFRYLGRIGGEQGYVADLDDGQRYAYVNVG